jgi:glycine/D-amino acid oxidase-like deaminating enzyme
VGGELPAGADAVICGAGIAGIATAWQLAERLGRTNALLIDPRPPLSLTSDKSGANYRDWWPRRPMVELVGRSIDLMERLLDETGAAFEMNRRGYLYVTADPARAASLPVAAERYRAAGIAEIRIHGRGRPARTPPSTVRPRPMASRPSLTARTS